MFQKAIPVWTEQQLNTHLIFELNTYLWEDAVLRLSAADFYKLYLNGELLGVGPARTAEGYARVDEYPLPVGETALTVEVAGYRCRSLSTVFQNSFFIAEILFGDYPAYYTGGEDFTCLINITRERKVERYSVQRHFGEVYRLRDDELLIPTEVQPAPVELTFIPRRVPYADLSVHELNRYTVRGRYEPDPHPTGRINAYSFAVDREVEWGYFPEEEIKEFPYRWVGAQRLTPTERRGNLPVTLEEGDWLMLDFGRVEVGFLRLTVTPHTEADLVLAFAEHCPDDVFQLSTMNAQTVVQYNMSAGLDVERETFEPYSFGKAALFVKKGSITLRSFGFRNYARSLEGLLPRSFKDPALQGIYEAAVRTFAHNAVDLYTDCPSRERAGWLCDSYFTGRAEHFLFGACPIEEAFLENFVLYKNNGEFPEGVVPMVYPADGHGVEKYKAFKFIPQWDLWYVLEVCEYLTLRNPLADRERFRPSVEGVLRFFAQYENEFGLPERLPSWNFVEWSKANDWTWDVNYPTCFLYAAALEQAGTVFGIREYKKKAETVRKEVRERAFNGEVFFDHALRTETGLANQPHVSEAGQYYAALFGGTDPKGEEYARFYQNIRDCFADYAARNPQVDFCAADAFIGLYLRMNVLHELGDPALMAENLKGFFGGMCELTGTLWEYRTPHKSLDHGFASYAAVTLPLADES